MSRDWCQFFNDIEKDPDKIINDLTIGEYYQARNHVNKCVDCQETTERVLRNYPPQNQIGFNVN